MCVVLIRVKNASCSESLTPQQYPKQGCHEKARIEFRHENIRATRIDSLTFRLYHHYWEKGVDSRREKGVLFIRIGVRRIDADNQRIIKEELKEALKEPGPVVLNFSSVTFMDSPGLGAILSSVRNLHDRGDTLAVCCLSSAVKTLFELVGLNRIVKVYDSEEEYLETL
jgi:anti-anti-sigma factor